MWEDIFVPLTEEWDSLGRLFEAGNSLQSFRDSVSHGLEEELSNIAVELEGEAPKADVVRKRDESITNHSSKTDHQGRRAANSTCLEEEFSNIAVELEDPMAEVVWKQEESITNDSSKTDHVQKRVGDAVSRLEKAIILVKKQFKASLAPILDTITRVEDINTMNYRSMEETQMLISQLKGAEDLLLKCQYTQQLDELNALLLKLFQSDTRFTNDVEKRSSSGGESPNLSLLKGPLVGRVY